MSEQTATVTGPTGEERSRYGTLAALSLAQHRAAHHDQPGTWYVRVDGSTAYVVERHADRSITTTRRAAR